MTNKTILFFSILLCLNFNTVGAQEDFSFSIDCLNGCNGKEMEYSQNIMLKVTIKNNYDYWVCIGDETKKADLKITVENNKLENGKDYYIYNDFIGSSFYIMPNSEVDFFIPFYLYNGQGDDERVGNWVINPELMSINGKLYKDPYNSEFASMYTGKSNLPETITGNPLEFKSIKYEEDDSNQGNIGEIINNPTIKWILENFIYVIFVSVITGVIIALILKWIIPKIFKSDQIDKK